MRKSIRKLLQAFLLLPFLMEPAQALIGEGAEAEAIEQGLAAASAGEPVAGVRLLPEVGAFYARREFAPAWRNDELDALTGELAQIDDDGLDPEDYHLTRLRERDDGLLAPAAARAETELIATDAALRALADLSAGKLDPRRVDPHWGIPARREDARKRVLDALEQAGTGGIPALFARLRPQHPLYDALRRTYAQMREQARHEVWPRIPAGPTLRPGDRGERVAALRTRLAVGGHLAPQAGDTDLFDERVSAAVMQFQHAHGLDADGLVGRGTLAALNQSPAARADQLRANLERARWALDTLPQEYVLVDIAAFRVDYVRDGKVLWRARAQVGRSGRSTPVLASRITHFTLNPTWTVPPTIFRQDLLPKLQKDPEFLASQRIRVLDTDGAELDPTTVDWSQPGPVLLRQDAGGANALGKVAIRFPNRHAVYLHDTPHQRLFQLAERTLSSGCVRVENALELTRMLLERDGNGQRDAAEALLASGRTGNVSLPRPVPVVLLYMTAGLGEDGRVQLRPDIYGRDPALLKALGAAGD